MCYTETKFQTGVVYPGSRSINDLSINILIHQVNKYSMYSHRLQLYHVCSSTVIRGAGDYSQFELPFTKANQGIIAYTGMKNFA